MFSCKVAYKSFISESIKLIKEAKMFYIKLYMVQLLERLSKIN